MADEQANGHGTSRLDRLEALVEVLVNEHIAFADEHKKLLTAQVLLTDRFDQLAMTVADIGAATKKLAETQQHSDEKLNALINVVDDLVRKRPPQIP